MNICAKYHENENCTFHEITTSVMNVCSSKRTNELKWLQYLVLEVTKVLERETGESLFYHNKHKKWSNNNKK